MKISVEVSMYPLKNEYISDIQNFIDRVNSCAGLQVITNTMSTQICGDYDAVMDVMHEEMHRSFEESRRAIFVCKFIERDLSPRIKE